MVHDSFRFRIFDKFPFDLSRKIPGIIKAISRNTIRLKLVLIFQNIFFFAEICAYYEFVRKDSIKALALENSKDLCELPLKNRRNSISHKFPANFQTFALGRIRKMSYSLDLMSTWLEDIYAYCVFLQMSLLERNW